MEVYRRLLFFLRPYRARVLVAVLATFVFAGATSLYAFLLGPLLKVLVTGQPPGDAVKLLEGVPPSRLLAILPIALVLASVVRAGAQAAQAYLMQSTGQRIVADLRRALYARFIGLHQGWLAKHHSSDLLARFGADVQGVEFALTSAFASYVKDGVQILTLLVVCAVLDWRLLLVALIAVPVAAFPIARFAKSLKKVAEESQATLGALATRVGESVANVRVVQAFRQEEAELGRLDATQGRYLGIMRRSFLLRAAFTPVLEMLGVLGLALAVYFAGSAIAAGTLSGEALLSFLAALMLMYQPVKALSSTSQHVIQGLANARRLFEVLDAPEWPGRQAGEAPVARFSDAVRFEGVTFAYGGTQVLHGIDLTLRRGRTLALVGESGSGKTTLGSLLLRFWDVSGGRITVDGVDVRALDVHALRSLVAYVPQEPVLFAGTVRENVGCGREGATDEEIVEALRKAHAWDFVSAMEGVLEAQVGERGARLSGGQRQRLAIARAFLSDRPILLLDEATSALDTASESAVQRALDALLAERTALIIAHRLSTVERAHEIAVLAAGRVVERGTHAELLARDGAYARLCASQLGAAPAARQAG